MSWVLKSGKVLTENNKIAIDLSCCCGCCENMPLCIDAEYENECGVYAFPMCFRSTAPEFTPPHHYGRVQINCRPDAYTPCGDTDYYLRFYLHTYTQPGPDEGNCVLTWYCDSFGETGQATTIIPTGQCDPFEFSAVIDLEPVDHPCHPCAINPGGISEWRAFE